MKHFLPTFFAAALFAATPLVAEESRGETTVFSTSIGKWEKMVIRKGVQMIPEDSSGVSGSSDTYYAIDIDSYTRDRDGQGVYREAVSRILHCDAADAKLTSTAKGIELVFNFRQSQGDGKSTILIAATKQTDGDDVDYSVKFSGSGGVHEGFQQRFAESVDGAEWVESIAEMRWQYFEPVSGANLDSGVAATGAAAQSLPIYPGKSELDAVVYPLGWAKDGTQVAVVIAHALHYPENERRWEIFMTDLITDKTVISEEILFDPDRAYPDFLAAHGQAIDNVCVKHAVTRTEMTIHPFPALLDAVGGRPRSEAYRVDSVMNKGPETTDDGGAFRFELEVTISNGPKSKTLLNRSWPGWEGDSAPATGVIGYIPNPDASRIAVIVGVVEPGFEGAPHTREIMIVGSRVGKKF